MPIYQFKSEGGEVIEEVVPVGTKDIIFDGEKYFRCLEPTGFAFTGNSTGMPSQTEQVRRGYYKLETEGGSGFKSSYSKKQIKKAWGI